MASQLRSAAREQEVVTSVRPFHWVLTFSMYESADAGENCQNLQLPREMAQLTLARTVTINLFDPNYFIHAANVLLLVAYSVRDILWLRLCALASSLIAIPYFILQPKPLWAPISWSVLFAAINIFQSWRLLVERRPVKLTSEEEYVRQLVFEDVPPRKVLQVLSIGYWTTTETGERLIERGKCPEAISLIVHGKVQVMRDGLALGELVAGNLVGSALLLSGAPADVDAMAVEPVRAMRWEVATLQRYLAANPEVRITMQRHLAHDLAGKVVAFAERGNRGQERRNLR